MKKHRLICATLSAILFLSACQSPSGSLQTNPSSPSVSSPTVSESPTPPDIIPGESLIFENMYSIALPVTTENYYTENQELLYSYTYQTIYPVCQDRDVADKIVMHFTDRIEKTRTVSNDILASAEATYNAGNYTAAFSYEIQYNATRIDQGILSLFGHVVQIGDTPRANSKLISVNYDMVTGDVLTVGSILYHIDTKDDLSALTISNLEKRDDIRLFDDFRSTVSARFSRDESIDEDFYFSENGLCFYFASNEIAPRSYGTVVVEIPYNELTQIIGDAYFPAERSYSSGNIHIHKFSEADLDSYQQFVEVITEENTTKLLLSTDSAVQDIRIYQLIWVEDGLAYTQAKNIYASNFLSAENAILLEGEFSAFRPSFMLSYSVNGETVTNYMIADPASGDITLESSYSPL